MSRLDSCAFGEGDGLDISEITPGESSVFVAAPPQQHRGLSVVSSTFVPSTDNQQPLVSKLPLVINPLAAEMGFGPTQPVEDKAHHQFPADGEADPPAAGLGYPADNGQFEGNRTVMFDDQDGGTMDLTLMDTSRANAPSEPAPKISAREFLSKLMGGGNYQVVRMHQVREEQTVLFSNNDGSGVTMEFTQNLPQNHLTTTTATLNTSRAAFTSVAMSDGAAVPGSENRTILFGNADAADDMTLTTNLSPVNMSSVEGNKMSAKSFLASLQGDRPSGPNPFAASQPWAVTSLDPTLLPAQSPCDQEEQREDMDVTVTMEMTGCLDAVSKPFILPQSLSSASSTAFHSVQPPSSLAQGPQWNLSTALHNNSDVAETMELTGCVENTQQLLLDANSSAVTAANLPALNEGSISGKSPSRSALVDITSRYSTSPTPSLQATAPVEEAHRAAAQSQCSQTGTMPTRAAVMPVPNKTMLTGAEETAADMSLTCATLPHTVSHGKSEVNKTIVMGAEDTAANMSLTCAALPHTVSHEKSQMNKTIVTGAEGTAADMSLTCATPSHTIPHGTSQANKTTLTRAEDTVANMSLTCATLSHSGLHGKSQNNNSTVSAAEETAAGTNLTCSGLSLTQQENRAPVNRSVLFKMEETAVDMSLTCAGILPVKPDTKCQAEKSVLFRAEDTAANMSLTCVSLVQKRPDHVNTTLTTGSDHTEKHQLPEKSIVFAAEATAANMSLTCSDLPQAQATKPDQTRRCEEEEVISEIKSDQSQLLEEDDVITFKSGQTHGLMETTCTPPKDTQTGMSKSAKEQTVVFSADETMAQMTLTCPLPSKLVSHDGGDCSDSKQINTGDVSNFTQCSIDAQPLATGAQSMSCPVQGKGCLLKEGEEDDTFNKEPPTLAELTEVFAQLKKKMEEQTASATMEADVKNKAAQVEDAVCTASLPQQQQPGSETVRAGPSRKLQLPPTTMPPLIPCMSREFNTQREKGVGNTLPKDSLKRHLLSSNLLGGEPVTKNPRLSSQAPEYTANKEGSGNIPQQTAIGNQKKPQASDPYSVEATGKANKTADSVSPPKEIKNSSNLTMRVSPTQRLNRTTSSSSSNSTPSPDILCETMPTFFPSAANTSSAAGASTSVSAMSVSVMQNTTGSSVSLGRSFMDKQVGSLSV